MKDKALDFFAMVGLWTVLTMTVGAIVLAIGTIVWIAVTQFHPIAITFVVIGLLVWWATWAGKRAEKRNLMGLGDL